MRLKLRNILIISSIFVLLGSTSSTMAQNPPPDCPYDSPHDQSFCDMGSVALTTTALRSTKTSLYMSALTIDDPDWNGTASFQSCRDTCNADQNCNFIQFQLGYDDTSSGEYTFECLFYQSCIIANATTVMFDSSGTNQTAGVISSQIEPKRTGCYDRATACSTKATFGHVGYYDDDETPVKTGCLGNHPLQRNGDSAAGGTTTVSATVNITAPVSLTAENTCDFGSVMPAITAAVKPTISWDVTTGANSYLVTVIDGNNNFVWVVMNITGTTLDASTIATDLVQFDPQTCSSMISGATLDYVFTVYALQNASYTGSEQVIANISTNGCQNNQVLDGQGNPDPDVVSCNSTTVTYTK